jgi:anti-sigma factor RsiW
MITRMPRSCVVHRAALLDFVDGQPAGDGTAAALDHLERCRACEDELAGIARTLAALRRLGQASSAVEPPTYTWAVLRSRLVARRAGRWLPRFSIAGLAVSAVLVAVISGPAAIVPGGAWVYHRTTVDPEAVARPSLANPQRRHESVTTSSVGGALPVAVSAPRFDSRVYGEAPWTPEGGAPKPRPR